jgi:hypothetical protein
VVQCLSANDECFWESLRDDQRQVTRNMILFMKLSMCGLTRKIRFKLYLMLHHYKFRLDVDNSHPKKDPLRLNDSSMVAPRFIEPKCRDWNVILALGYLNYLISVPGELEVIDIGPIPTAKFSNLDVVGLFKQ